MDDEPANSGLLQDEEFWFDDGNVILVAGEVQFRVYMGPLMRHAPVFADMFSFPQPPDQAGIQPQENRVPTVYLADSPSDLRHFLRCITLGKDLMIGPIEPSFDEISACMRLGHKYQCDQMVQRSIDYLKDYFPDDIDVWVDDAPHDPPKFEPIHRIGVVNLARTTGADALLPVALARCCLLDGEIVSGFAREDGTPEALARDDLARVFAGKARLMHTNVYATHRVFRQAVAKDCKRAKACEGVLRRLLTELVQDEAVMDPLRLTYAWGAYVDRIEVKKGDGERELCAKCYAMLKTERVKEEQRALFRALPAMMGVTVEGWATKPGADATASTP
ncbi:uncharacterized protein TRAVEDRAFT_170768 [Trametes versicolor FP-101664 SS1]|uniref:uncharacterized protein n=1 Tax=Trametes versicolor (strain FP-101664) TaxID=717944 RepID=UPI00046229A6|nr:uncharacterized protein TRAVEDRAFT_170768 [Trametes versicolor FP-101664 SS1]EIW56792.1 hypothetical protein TRAVEDRAFT_170768 [Trametes versicolor FP-101664 SS1]